MPLSPNHYLAGENSLIEWFVLTLNEVFGMAFFVGLFVAFFNKIKLDKKAIFSVVAVIVSLVFAFLFNGGYIVSKQSNIKYFEGIMHFAAVLFLVAEIIILILLKKYAGLGRGKSVSLTVLSLMALAVLIFPKSLKAAQLIDRILFQSSMINTDLIANVSGLSLALIFCLSFAWIVAKNAKRLSAGVLIIFLSFLALPGLISNTVFGLQMFVLEGYLPMDQKLLSVLIPLINNQNNIGYIVYVVALIFIPLIIFGKDKFIIPEMASTKAESRKNRAYLRREIRFIIALVVSLFTAYIVLGANAYLQRETEISVASAKEISAEKGRISIPLKSIGNKMERFTYEGKNNDVVFLAIHKGSGVYGVALDACQICGPAGFFQKDNNIVCSACQSVITKSTLGFAGGCNPIPIDFKIANGYMVIDENELTGQEKVFEGKGLK